MLLFNGLGEAVKQFKKQYGHMPKTKFLIDSFYNLAMEPPYVLFAGCGEN